MLLKYDNKINSVSDCESDDGDSMPSLEDVDEEHHMLHRERPWSLGEPSISKPKKKIIIKRTYSIHGAL